MSEENKSNEEVANDVEHLRHLVAVLTELAGAVGMTVLQLLDGDRLDEETARKVATFSVGLCKCEAAFTMTGISEAEARQRLCSLISAADEAGVLKPITRHEKVEDTVEKEILASKEV